MQTLHDIDAMVREQQLMLQGFGNAVSNLVERVTRLEEANNGRLIKEMGNGPTEQSK